jgi:hypothetical protein
MPSDLSVPARRGRRALCVDVDLASAQLPGHTNELIYVREASQRLPDAESDAAWFSQLRAAAGARVTQWLELAPYMEDLEPRILLALRTGRFYSAAAEPKAPYVARDDAALVAANLLASDAFAPGSLSVTGPSSLNHRELARQIAEVFGRPVVVSELAASELEEALLRAGLSPASARAARRQDASLARSELATSDSIAQITGLSATDLRRRLVRLRDAGVTAFVRPAGMWNAAAAGTPAQLTPVLDAPLRASA